MKLKKHQEIKLKLPSFQVDTPLSPHLDEIPLLQLLNKSFACSFIGRAGSGKTSLMTGLLQTKHKFKKVFKHTPNPNQQKNFLFLLHSPFQASLRAYS